jgi:hypothetical protein
MPAGAVPASHLSGKARYFAATATTKTPIFAKNLPMSRGIIILGMLSMLIFACKKKESGGGWDVNQDRKVAIEALEKEVAQSAGEAIDFERGRLLIQQYEQYARSLPGDSLAPVYLFKAAEVARGMRDFGLAIRLWAEVNERYPDYQLAPEALFLQALITEQDLQKPKAAVPLYEAFLQRYPSHYLYKDARLLHDNCKAGKTDADLIDSFEQQAPQQ